MTRLISLLTVGCMLMVVAPVWAEDEHPSYVGVYKKTAEDKAAIEKVISDFQRAIRDKDKELLKSLFMHEDILFISPPTQDVIDMVRERDADFMRSHPSQQANITLGFMITEDQDNEERFYNVEIKQDGTFALVHFDYDFVTDGTPTNYGFEVWNMFKIDGDWRIASVTWSYNPLTK
ncbi:YybH family protein [Kordiimonas sp.]|uniref:YybH family protein n=1 Tax=Kordiimonas sp. TaxID=1970157 RepID=UPI003A8E82D8